MSDNTACTNTDRELWRERDGDFYADSIHVTEGGGIGINCGGNVFVKPLRGWHLLAVQAALSNCIGYKPSTDSPLCLNCGMARSLHASAKEAAAPSVLEIELPGMREWEKIALRARNEAVRSGMSATKGGEVFTRTDMETAAPVAGAELADELLLQFDAAYPCGSRKMLAEHVIAALRSQPASGAGVERLDAAPYLGDQWTDKELIVRIEAALKGEANYLLTIISGDMQRVLSALRAGPT